MHRIKEGTDIYSISIGHLPPELGRRNRVTTNYVTITIHYALNRVWFEGFIWLQKEYINIIC